MLKIAVYLPTAALGNSRFLVTVGGAGELMGLFYPHLDDAQNIREGMPAFLVERDGGRHFAWTFEPHFSSTQHFEESSNILVTELHCPSWGLSATLMDLVPPEEAALVRQVRVKCDSPAAYGHYFDLNVSGIGSQNAVHYLPDRRVLVQGRRGTFVAVTATLPFSYQCGKVRPDGASVTKRDFGRGQLSGQEQATGDVDFALWVSLPTPDEVEFSLAIACHPERERAAQLAGELASARFADLRAEVVDRSRVWLAPKLAAVEDAPQRDDREFAQPFQRALISLRDLHDQETGAILAAPEFDPAYEQCGGYGYCWPRDAVQAALALARAGDREISLGFFRWCARTQLDDGHWYQRYWSTGELAPSWCVYPDFYQLDQTASVLHGICGFLQLLPEAEAAAVRTELQKTASAAAKALIAALGPEGLHLAAADLWEQDRGSFTYTNAAIYGALKGAAEVFGLNTLSHAQRVKEAVLRCLWLEAEGRFARGLGPDGQLDTEGDSSILGVFDPFDLLDPADRSEGRKAALVLEWVDAHLTLAVPLPPVLSLSKRPGEVGGRGWTGAGEGKAVLRHQNDPYMGGAAGSVNTLWAARAQLRLACAEAKGGEVLGAARRMEIAKNYMRTALAYATPTGQLGELLVRDRHPWWWAAPHAWASGLLVDCVLLLRECNKGMENGEWRMEN